MGGQETADRTIARLARYGVVARAALLSADVSARQIERRVERGVLHAVHRGVYAVGHTSLSREGRWLAAVLACGDGALLSHWSAAALWELVTHESADPHVTTDRRRRPEGVCPHRARLTAADRAIRHGIPVTSVSRTLVDLAPLVGEERLERIVGEAQFRRRFNVAAIREALERRPNRALRRLLDDLNPTQSQLEDAFLRLCRGHRIPPPRAQVRDGRKRPDFVWAERRLVVEADSWLAHGTPRAFQADRTQSNALQLAGWTILRFTHADVTRRPELVARQIRAVLAHEPGIRGGSEVPANLRRSQA
jgi:very-short-patch-repair endonuclease